MSSPFPASADLQKPVSVFCGSSPGKLPLFTKAAQAVGEALARANVPVVYGGGRRGIMGVVSQSALTAGGYVHGIVPNALVEGAAESPAASSAVTAEANAQSKEGSGEEIVKDETQEKLTTQVVGTMHERKLAMANLSTGGFIVLPGGYGTFEEALEMITWNQLGIHRLPVIILNIGGFYTNLYKQFESSVQAGFVAEENLALLKLVELEGGAEGEEGRAEEWGAAALKALREWNLDSNAGLKLDWSNTSTPKANVSSPTYVFSTLRYTSQQHAGNIALLETHLERLREAFTHFSTLEPARWGTWPGDETLVTALNTALKQKDEQGPHDSRVRWVVYPGGKVEVQMPPAPKDSGNLDIPTEKSPQLRPVVLDPQVTHIARENQSEKDYRLYKTDQREMYDAVYARGGQLSAEHPEVIIHNGTHLLETTTSNIAILRSTEQRWITPRIGSSTPLLNGVLRRYLLEKGAIEVGELTLQDLDMVKKGQARLIGFNGLRGIWEGRIL
ncbi:TIGR00730 family protein [Cryptococcus amylolentus CBS 6273]|uniref:TIGR00730 family protein n=1 Tax=Cryptococcus amylolentus CBS 6273 TaxID=1296118 RepID=A0A1E3KCY0_9TREE|nr:TIGR00730 family protein [Cryptococcus amylolentus CBS 6273]